MRDRERCRLPTAAELAAHYQIAPLNACLPELREQRLLSWHEMMMGGQVLGRGA